MDKKITFGNLKKLLAEKQLDQVVTSRALRLLQAYCTWDYNVRSLKNSVFAKDGNLLHETDWIHAALQLYGSFFEILDPYTQLEKSSKNLHSKIPAAAIVLFEDIGKVMKKGGANRLSKNNPNGHLDFYYRTIRNNLAYHASLKSIEEIVNLLGESEEFQRLSIYELLEEDHIHSPLLKEVSIVTILSLNSDVELDKLYALTDEDARQQTRKILQRDISGMIGISKRMRNLAIMCLS